MKDINGNEIKTGMVVEIKNAYFKSENGLYFVEYSPNDPDWSGEDHSLTKLNKNGTISQSKNNIGAWPLVNYVSDPVKSAEADKWNEENATIEIVEPKTYEHIKAHFEKKAERYNRQGLTEMRDFCKAVAA